MPPAALPPDSVATESGGGPYLSALSPWSRAEDRSRRHSGMVLLRFGFINELMWVFPICPKNVKNEKYKRPKLVKIRFLIDFNGFLKKLSFSYYRYLKKI